ncbi:MAG: DnaB-like helicase C-terminal domain-containing protein [Gemmataceae bacterium]
MTATFTTGADLFGSWFADVERGEPPTRYTLPDPFAALDIRPGRLILFGGAPGAGKTAAMLQVGIDMLRMNDTARLMIANVEMVPRAFVERIASWLSAVPLTAIADRTLTPDQLGRVRAAVSALAPVAARLAFLDAPFSLEHVAAAGTAFGANVLMIDYIQRVSVGDGKGEKREQLETAATVLRRFCDAGAAALVASAVSRQKSQSGSTYKGLNLASFRGSSELEFGCDSAYLFTPSDGFDPEKGGPVTLECGKNRYRAPADIVTSFDTTTQTFTPAPSGLDGFDAATPARTRKTTAKGI